MSQCWMLPKSLMGGTLSGLVAVVSPILTTGRD